MDGSAAFLLVLAYILVSLYINLYPQKKPAKLRPKITGRYLKVAHTPTPPKRPPPIPEDPAVPELLLAVLEEHNIPYLQFGKLLRLNGQVIYGVEVEKEHALAVWRELVSILPEVGFYPAFVHPWPIIPINEGGQSEMDEPREVLTLYQPSPDAIIQAAEMHDMSRIDRLVDEVLSGREQGTQEESSEPSYQPPEDNFRTGHIVFYPTPHSWQVPAFWSFDYDEKLEPGMILAFLRRWEETYGAKVLFFVPNSMDMMIDTPPQKKEDALRLVVERHYFNDNWYMIRSHLESQAEYLMKAKCWRFVWFDLLYD